MLSLSEVDDALGDGLVDRASVNDVAVEEGVALGRVELQVVDLHIGEVLVFFGEQRVATDEDVARLSLELVLPVKGVAGRLRGNQLVVDEEVETGGRMPRDLIEIPFADAVERRGQSPDLTGGADNDIHDVLLVEKGESLRALEVASVG